MTQGTQSAEARLQTILKAFVVEAKAQGSAILQAGEDYSQGFDGTGALDPPYDQQALCILMEHSNCLRQNVDAYATNIDGFGHRFEPAIDLDADGADKHVADCILLERQSKRTKDGETQYDANDDPTPEDIATRKAEIAQLARRERARLENFFDFCCFDHSFVELRRRTRQDLEITGNAYWEILRNVAGEIVKLVYVPAHTVRLLPLDENATEVEEQIRISPIACDKVPIAKRLRRYVQIQGAKRVYFKSLGDPRFVSAETGRVGFSSMDVHSRVDRPATELLHFAIHSPRTPYGIPRWVGTLLSVMGSRQMEEVNYLYFENKSVPPMALLVSGGKLSDASVPRIERFIDENIKGKNNFHKILILEADTQGPAQDSGKVKIEIKPLTDAQQNDALFQVYDERNMDKVGGAFRLPRLLRGESKDFNRSIADTQLRFAEDQVFQPERDEFDYIINRKILAAMGICFWRFRSQTPITRDPERLSNMVEKLVRVGVLTPEEGRMLAADIFNREFRKIGDDWTKRPITLTLAGIQTGVQDLHKRHDSNSILDDAQKLIRLREQLESEEQRLAADRLRMAQEYWQQNESESESGNDQ